MIAQATCSTLEVRSRAVRAVLAGNAITHVAEIFGVSRRTLTYWLERHQQDPVNGLARKKSPGSARPRKAPGVDANFLIRLTASDAARHGFDSNLWTACRVKQVLDRSPETRLSKTAVHERLREARLTRQKPAANTSTRMATT